MVKIKVLQITCHHVYIDTTRLGSQKTLDNLLHIHKVKLGIHTLDVV